MSEPIPTHPGNVLPFARSRAAPDRPATTGMSGILRVGLHRVDLGALRVVSDPERPRLTLKAAMVLVELARRCGQTLSRDDLLDTVWAGTTPTPEVVTQAIRELRRVLGDNGAGPRHIETVPKLGYRLVAPAEFIAVSSSEAATANDAAVAVPAADDEPPAVAPPRRRSRIGFAVAGVALLAVLVAVAATFAPAPSVRRTEWRAVSTRVLTNLPGAEQYPRVSNDATRLSYTRRNENGKDRIYVRDIDASRAREIDSADDIHDYYSAWSPSGAEIAFLRKDKNQQRCRIVATPPAGGAVRELGECGPHIATLFDWAPDGSHIVSSGVDRGDTFATRPVVQRAGAAPQDIDYPRPPSSYDLDPKYSADGRRLAFRRGTIPFSDLYVMDVGDPDSVRRLTRLASTMFGYDWARDGSALVFSSDHEGPPALFAVDIADGHVEPLGIAPAIWPDLARDADTGVYEVPDHRIQMRRIDLGGEAASMPLAPSSANDVAARLSPDGTRVAFLSDRSGSWQVWVLELASGDTYALSRLERGMPEFPEWRGDGRAVAFITHGSGPGEVREIELGSRVERRIGSARLDARRVTYGTDGSVLLVAVKNGAAALYRLDGKEERELVADASFARMTPNGDVLFNYADRDGLFRLRPGKSDVEFLSRHVSNRMRRGWELVDGQIYYVDVGRSHAPVMRYDIATGRIDELVSTDCNVQTMSLTVAQDRRSAFAGCVDSQESDVAEFRLTRNGSHNG